MAAVAVAVVATSASATAVFVPRLDVRNTTGTAANQIGQKSRQESASLAGRVVGGRRQAQGRVERRQLRIACEITAGAAAAGTATQTAGPPTGPPPKAPVKQEDDVRVVALAEDTVTLRGRSTERFKFEVEYNLQRGTTDNSYVVSGPNGAALVSIPDDAFSEAFVRELRDKVGLEQIKYLIIPHYSPKRSTSLKLFLEALERDKKLEVYCSNAAAKTIRETEPAELLEEHVDFVIVRNLDETLDLGGGHHLRFLLTPTPRWPDGMVTYDPATQVLYTHKLFSGHVCTEDDFDEGGWDTFGTDWAYFFDCMLAPTPTQAKQALERLALQVDTSGDRHNELRGLQLLKADAALIWDKISATLRMRKTPKPITLGRGDNEIVVSTLAPLHGPIITQSVAEIVREYNLWTDIQLEKAKTASVVLLYASAYGNTAALAQAISRGITKAGVAVETINTEFAPMSEVAEAVARSSGIVLGSPTLGGHMPTPMKETLGVVLRDETARNKPCGVFGSFGWSGEAVDEMQDRLTDAGFKFAFDAIRVKFKPTEASLQVCEESGTDLAQAVLRQKQKQKGMKPTFTADSNLEQAVGRLVGTLCILSAKSGDAESAMVASWVSQASFQPPGLTVAVAKDRAVESLILPGARFVLNVLGDNAKLKPILKQLLKQFKPGEERFGDLPTTVSEATGARILSDAISYLECTVEQRMETGDHWVLYASVNIGKLQNEDSLSALHYRKTGKNY